VDPERRVSLFRTIRYYIERGFHAWKIAEICGCSEGNVYTAAAKLQMRLRDYRDGKGDVAERIIQVAPSIAKVLRRAR
jgi:hypothetical protein